MQMNTRLRTKLNCFVPLTDEERSLLESALSNPVEFDADVEVLGEDQNCDHVWVLEEGWAFRYKYLSDGRRQIHSFLLPGDMIGFRTCVFGMGGRSVQTQTPIRARRLSVDSIVSIFQNQPRLALALSWAAARDELIISEHVVRLGRQTAYERIAHLLLEFEARLRVVGLADDDGYDFPVTQEQLADALGLSVVHVNRTLKKLRQHGYIETDNKRVVFRNRDDLEEIGDFYDLFNENTRPPESVIHRLLEMTIQRPKPRKPRSLADETAVN